MDPAPPATPLADSGRIAALDFIRGFAVLGILFANIVPFAHPMAAAVWPGGLAIPAGRADEAVWWVHFLLIDGRMRGLFTLLFGVGLVLFVDAKGERLQARRLFWLAWFGLAHFYLLFRGDILFSYAACGLVALGFARLRAANLLTLGFLLYPAGAILSGMMYWPSMMAEQDLLRDCAGIANCLAARPGDPLVLQYAQTLADASREAVVMQDGFRGIVAYNWTQHGTGPLEGAVLSLFETLPLILIGMGLLRAGMFDPGVPQARLLRWGVAGTVAGIVLSAPLGWWLVRQGHPLYLSFFVSMSAGQMARLPMILGLAALLTWLAPRAGRTAPGRRLIAAGRTAFTNYLGTSLAMAFVFQGWGLAWFGKLDRAELLVPVVTGWLIMLAWPVWWLARYRYGPLEWLWRCLTYARFYPLRR